MVPALNKNVGLAGPVAPVPLSPRKGVGSPAAAGRSEQPPALFSRPPDVDMPVYSSAPAVMPDGPDIFVGLADVTRPRLRGRPPSFRRPPFRFAVPAGTPRETPPRRPAAASGDEGL